MRIVILGPGRIGSALAGLLVDAGHEVMLSAYRDADAAFNLADAIGARMGSLEDAADFGEVFFLTVPHSVVGPVLQRLHDARGVLVDCTNQWGGYVPEGVHSTSEQVAQLVPKLAVVKAFNTIRADELRGRAHSQAPVAVVFSTDSQGAASVVDKLVRDCGFAPLNLGPLSNGLLQEPGSVYFLKVMDLDEALRIAKELESAEGMPPSVPQ
ncbi:MAG: NAD(P)-binding domain-containing protein [Deltaproteobacteria bacterium]|nr:NAD(P)-binding domain-containing protein [Deltaproteobacteria bacterium]